MAKDKEKGITIVIKKVQGKKAGAHGGAWKVAYADFVTAMMAFFLVMWLMGADEATKASISHYFNHPNTPYDKGRDPISETANPLGEKFGQGDTILKGADGGVPEDLVKEPLHDLKDALDEKLGEQVYGIDLDADIEQIKFSMLGDDLFDEGSADVKKEALPSLAKLAEVFKKVQGNILIEGHLDNKPLVSGEDPYLFSTQRAVSIMNYFVKKQSMDEDRFCPRGIASRRAWAARTPSSDDARNRRIEFTVTPNNVCTQ